MSSKSPLRLLGDIISSSIDKIDARLADASLLFPPLKDPFNPTLASESLLLEPDMLAATSLIIAAASQLIATVRHPAQSILDGTMGFHLSSCLRAVVQSNTVEIVRDAGPTGIHVSEIAKKNNTDPLKLGRILRLLSNHHIFQEITPDVFANNRLASMLDSGKTPEQLTADPRDRHLTGLGIVSLVEITADEVFKGSAYLPETFLGPKTAHSDELVDSPWNKAYGTDLPLFVWLDQPDKEYNRIRFSSAIAGTSRIEPLTAILSGFQWSSLPKGGTIVDVGGGVGSSSLLLAQAIPDVRIVVQDREGVILDAHKYWAETFPEGVESGRVKLEAYNFFTPQPVKEPAAILLRFIIHDWSDPYAKKILEIQREAAGPETKLIVVDIIVPYTCDAQITSEIPGASIPAVPAPLLPNLGAVSNLAYYMDIQMYVFVNGQDRTLGHFVQLAAETGWKVVKVHRIQGSAMGQYECVPV